MRGLGTGFRSAAAVAAAFFRGELRADSAQRRGESWTESLDWNELAQHYMRVGVFQILHVPYRLCKHYNSAIVNQFGSVGEQMDNLGKEWVGVMVARWKSSAAAVMGRAGCVEAERPGVPAAVPGTRAQSACGLQYPRFEKRQEGKDDEEMRDPIH